MAPASTGFIWRPTEEQMEVYKEWRRISVEYLVSCKKGIPIRKFPSDLDDIAGQSIPLNKMGFQNLHQFLYQMMKKYIEIRRVYDDLYIYVEDVAIPDHLKHIRKFVLQQDSDKSKCPNKSRGVRMTAEELLRHIPRSQPIMRPSIVPQTSRSSGAAKRRNRGRKGKGNATALKRSGIMGPVVSTLPPPLNRKKEVFSNACTSTRTIGQTPAGAGSIEKVRQGNYLMANGPQKPIVSPSVTTMKTIPPRSQVTPNSEISSTGVTLAKLTNPKLKVNVDNVVGYRPKITPDSNHTIQNHSNYSQKRESQREVKTDNDSLTVTIAGHRPGSTATTAAVAPVNVTDATIKKLETKISSVSLSDTNILTRSCNTEKKIPWTEANYERPKIDIQYGYSLDTDIELNCSYNTSMVEIDGEKPAVPALFCSFKNKLHFPQYFQKGMCLRTFLLQTGQMDDFWH